VLRETFGLLARDALRLGAAGAVTVLPGWYLSRALPDLDTRTLLHWVQVPPSEGEVRRWVSLAVRAELWDDAARFALLLVATHLARGVTLLRLPGAVLRTVGHWLAAWFLALAGVALTGLVLLAPAGVVLARGPRQGGPGRLPLDFLATATWQREGVVLASVMAAVTCVVVLLGGLLVLTPATLEDEGSALRALRRATAALRGNWGTAASVIFLLQLVKLACGLLGALLGAGPLGEVVRYALQALCAPMPALAGLALFRRLTPPPP
jgi:hypothetical protein